ncbi:ATP-binding protein [Deinococcus petrolearius]|uniref:histidine kinase n=1 Tax=Deinococcus petrolearius TaxID=1751295 RepID=A0ABW1DNF2_9DEIO
MTHQPPSQTTDAPLSAEARLQALEAQVRHLQVAATQASALFDAAPHAAFLLSLQGRVLDVNTRGAALLVSTPQALTGRHFTPLVAPASQATFTALLGWTFEGRGRQTGEVQALLPDGQVLDLVLEAALQRREGAPDVCYVTATDVTAFKAAHRTLLDVNQAQARQLQDQRQRLQRLEEEFESVTLLAIRELNAIVTRAANFLKLVKPAPVGGAPLTHAQEALEQTRELLDALKGYMRARTMRTRIRGVDLEKVLREVLKDLQPQMARRDVQVTSAPLPVLQGDSQVLQLLLHEYLSNALKFTRSRPQARVRLLVQETDTEYRVGVEDNGVGFNLRQKDKAFELFGRLHPGGMYGGIGLGLAVVRRLCERFGGRAWGEGKPDQGATFWFAWPKVPGTG